VRYWPESIREGVKSDYGVARYVSIEQRIFESKNAYYLSLYQSQEGWHGGEHSIWPWTTYLVRVLDDAYKDFEQRVAAGRGGTGNKQERVRAYILEQASEAFRTRDVQHALPDVSAGTIRLVLNELKGSRQIFSEGSGPGARWHRA
jgi:hypothetical protein